VKNAALLILAFGAGALAHDLVTSRAQAAAAAYQLEHFDELVRAEQRQAEALHELVSATKERCR
jgi:hypothetical protein